MTAQLKGACLCGQVSYEVSAVGENLVYCHCSYCRRATSSAFSINMTVPKTAVTLITGQDNLVTYDSSPGKTRFYCQTCHSQLYHIKADSPNLITLKVGLLENSPALATLPHKHIHQDQDFQWLEGK